MGGTYRGMVRGVGRHVQRNGEGYIGKRMLGTELQGRRRRGRPKRRGLWVDMQVVGETERDERDAGNRGR